MTDRVIAFLGNDGSGKTTLARLACQHPGWIGVERHINEQLRAPLHLDDIDRLTLAYGFEFPDEFPGPDSVEVEGRHVPVSYIFVDVDPATSDRRLSERQSRDHWETPKALFYYRQRFREVATYYGFPLVSNEGRPAAETLLAIGELLERGGYERERRLALRGMTPQWISEHDVEQRPDLLEAAERLVPSAAVQLSAPFSADELRPELAGASLWARLKLRWLVGGRVCLRDGVLTVERDGLSAQVPWEGPVLLITIEGESKRIYRIVGDDAEQPGRLVIQLKPSIYSHSRQSTGLIEGLERVRATGTQLFLEMLRRNGLRHAYRALNSHGVIVADAVVRPDGSFGSPLEVVVKEYLEGTDKHSYFGLREESGVLPDGRLAGGPYVRFDWRNPNHVCSDGTNPAASPYYYLIEDALGKEEFFRRYLAIGGGSVRPLGDKAISEDLAATVADVRRTRETALRTYLAIKHYLREVGVEIQDVCYMMSADGEQLYSEINQDCMRIKRAAAPTEGFDKDTWRAGGSSAKEQIVSKWTVFNDMMRAYFCSHRFQDTEQPEYFSTAYQQAARRLLGDPAIAVSPSYRAIYRRLAMGAGAEPRRVICTMDLYRGRPVLVKSGRVCEEHSGGSIEQAMERIRLFPDLLVVDLDGAFEEPSQNRAAIKSLARRYYVHTGGGVRQLSDVQELLESSARRVVVSSNTDEDFLRAIPKERLIVELSVDDQGRVLTHGRRVNTEEHALDRAVWLASLGVEALSFTFHATEGHLAGLPRSQVADLVLRLPSSIKKVIVAGGVSSLDDLEFLWSLPRVVPQLGSALWKGHLTAGQIYEAMARYNSDGLLPTVVQDVHGRNKGLVYLDPEAVRRTCDERILYRWSREHRRLMMKGATSGDIQQVVKAVYDCDNDSLLVVVDTANEFCHTGHYSCFNDQSVIKANLGTIKEHIQSKIADDSYSGQMQRRPTLALAKVMEEFWEVLAAREDRRHSVEECSDLLVHYLMYLNGIGIGLDEITNELNARRWNPRLSARDQPAKEAAPGASGAAPKLVLGITSSKYGDKTDRYCEQQLGFRVKRGSGRSLAIGYEVVDPELFRRHFGDRELSLVGARPKDLPWLMAMDRIQMAVSYNTVFENCPQIYSQSFEVPDPDLFLALIKRQGEEVDWKDWAPGSKVLIAAEHANHVHRYLVSQGIDVHSFTLDRIIGSSEAYLVADAKRRYLLCDAIVESGETLMANDLEVWKVVLPRGHVKVGLYVR